MSHRHHIRDVPEVPVPPKPLDVIRRVTAKNALDPRLEPTDRFMQRWAISNRGGGPVGPKSLTGAPPLIATRSRFELTPLSDPDVMLTDKIVAAMPSQWNRFVRRWYKSEVPTDIIAAELEVKRTTLYQERRLVLAYLLGAFNQSGMSIPSYRWR